MLQPIIRRPRIAEDIALGAQLAKMQGRPIGPLAVTRALHAARLKYVIVGTHATNGYSGRPRATMEVDVVVQFPLKAAKAIAAAFPRLQMTSMSTMIRFSDRKGEAIDLIKASSSKLWQQLLKEPRGITVGSERIKIPPLEGALAGKFAGIKDNNRKYSDKLQSAADFMRVVVANDEIDLRLLKEFGELVYAGGGKEILNFVADTRAERRFEVMP